MCKTKSKLKNNEAAYGGWMLIPHPAVAELMAGEGFDWIAIDMEHARQSQMTKNSSRRYGFGCCPLHVRGLGQQNTDGKVSFFEKTGSGQNYIARAVLILRKKAEELIIRNRRFCIDCHYIIYHNNNVLINLIN